MIKFEKIKINDYIRIEEEIGIITKAYKIDNCLIYCTRYGDGKEYIQTPIKKITKHGAKISDVLEEDDIIFYKINGFQKKYIGRVSKYKFGLGVNNKRLDKINIIKVITRKEIKETGFEINEGI